MSASIIYILSYTTSILDRYGISKRVLGAIATTTVSIFDNSASAPIFDRFKIFLAREKLRHKLTTSSSVTDFYCLAFDGRKDDTLNEVKKDGCHYKTISKEKHIYSAAISEPDSHYIGHISPKLFRNNFNSNCKLFQT